ARQAEWVKSGETLDRNPLLDQHHRDVLPDRIEDFLISPDQAAVEFLAHGLARLVLELPFRDPVIQPGDERVVGEGDILLRFRAAQDRQQLLIDVHFPRKVLRFCHDTSLGPTKPLTAAHRDEMAQALGRSEEHTSELQSRSDLVCRLLLEKKKTKNKTLLGIIDVIHSHSI